MCLSILVPIQTSQIDVSILLNALASSYFDGCGISFVVRQGNHQIDLLQIKSWTTSYTIIAPPIAGEQGNLTYGDFLSLILCSLFHSLT